jgi:hypothetical protein
MLVLTHDIVTQADYDAWTPSAVIVRAPASRKICRKRCVGKLGSNRTMAAPDIMTQEKCAGLVDDMLVLTHDIVTQADYDAWTPSAVSHPSRKICRKRCVGKLGSNRTMAAPDIMTPRMATGNSGAAMVLLEPNFPTQRLRHILRDAGARTMICSTGVVVRDG